MGFDFNFSVVHQITKGTICEDAPKYQRSLAHAPKKAKPGDGRFTAGQGVWVDFKL